MPAEGTGATLSAAQQFAIGTYHHGAPVNRRFVIRTDGGFHSPLERLLSSSRGGAGGGRGGRSRLALLLTLWWVHSRPGPDGRYTSSRTSGWWAEMIGIDDRSRGARVVSANFRELAERGFVELSPGERGKRPATVALLRDSGATALPYQRPDGQRGSSYFRVPEQLWTTGKIGDLSGPGLVMYLIMLERYRSDRPSQPSWFTTEAFNRRFGLSDDTRLAGTQNLYDTGVIQIDTITMDYRGDTNSGYHRRRRRLLTLLAPFRPPQTADRPEQPDVEVGSSALTRVDSRHAEGKEIR